MRKPCCEKEGINKGAWSKQEDRKLVDYIASHGEGCWRSLPQAAGLRRCGKSCRLRWINYLRPDIKRGNFALDEEDLIIKLHALLGNRWSLIAGRLPGRTDNEVKNYWNSHLRKKLIKMGIDPNNHKPHQHLYRPLTSHASHITESSNSMENTTRLLNPIKRENDITNFDDKAEGDQDQVSHTPLDLNLDLTISVSPRFHLEEIKCEDSPKLVGYGLTQVDASPSTLSLFR